MRFAGVFIAGILLAQFGLPLKQIGLYETMLFFSGAISFFWVGGILTKLLVTYHQYKESSFFFNVFILLVALSLLTFIVIQVFKTSIISWLKLSGSENIFELFTWYALLNAPSFLTEYIFLIKQNKKRILQYGCITGVLYVLCILIPLLLNGSAELIILFLTAFAFAKLLFLLALLLILEKPAINFKIILSQLKFSTPLILSLLASGSADYIDSFIVSGFFGQEKVALFRYGAKEFPLAVLLASALSSASIINFTSNKEINAALNDLRKSASRLMNILFPISIVLMLTSNFLYPLIYSPAFTNSAAIFNIYLLLLISRLIFPQTILIALGNSQIILLASVLEIAVNIFSSLFFLNLYGITGVALGTLTAFFFEKIFLSVFIYYKYKINPAKYLNVRQWLLYTTLLIMAYIFNILCRQ